MLAATASRHGRPMCPADGNADRSLAPWLSPVLGVASVRLPAAGIQYHSGTIWFTVEVYPENGAPAWCVLRRYSQFHGMKEKMDWGSCAAKVRAKRLPNAAFPRKGMVGKLVRGNAKLERRRRALEQWLLSTIQHAQRYTAWQTHLRVFLAAPSPGAPVAALVPQQRAPVPILAAPLACAPVAAVPQQSAPVRTQAGQAFAATAPPMTAGPASVQQLPPPENKSGAMAMEIEVPAGVSAGHIIGVEVPGGQQLLLTVPQGVMGGQLVKLWYDPAAQSLRPLL